jgi:hypothetical protein
MVKQNNSQMKSITQLTLAAIRYSIEKADRKKDHSDGLSEGFIAGYIAADKDVADMLEEHNKKEEKV